MQYVQNGCLKKAKLSKTPLGGRFAAPKGVLDSLGFFYAAIVYVLYIFCVCFVCILLYFGKLATF